MDLKFDIETIPSGYPKDVIVKVPGNYKKQESIDKYIEENRLEEFKKGGLNGLTGEIVSIAWQLGDDEIESWTTGEDVTDEETLLANFFSRITNRGNYFGEGLWPRFKWIGHNILDFDLRFLKQRCWVNNIKPPVLVPADAKHGDFAFDVMKEWAGWRGYVSQDALYKALGGRPFEDDDIDGSMVYDLWANKEYDKIRDYNKRDIEKLSFNYERLK